MPFGRKAGPSIVWSYGAREPVGGLPAVREQLSKAHRYYNRLIEIERQRRVAFRAARTAAFPELEAKEVLVKELVERLDAERAAIKAANAKARRRTATAEDRARIKQLAGELKEARAVMKVVRTAANADPALQVTARGIDEAAQAEKRAARAVCQVFWGTYLQIEAAADKASKTATVDPHFRRWTGDGLLAVQFQGGLAVDKLLLCKDQRARLEMVPSPSRTNKRAILWLRVGSDKREPVWAKIPVTVHRELPTDVQIKWVYLTVRRVGTKEKWGVRFIVTRPEGFARPDRGLSGRVGIDVGWRKFEDGSLRVAYRKDDEGEEGELRLSARILGELQKSQEVQGIADLAFDAMRERLANWLDGRTVPEWLREKTPALRKWKNHGRLAGVALHWRENRFEGDTEIFTAMEEWRKQDKHLVDWAAFQRRGVQMERLNLYRNFARTLARTYRQCIVEDADWRKLAKKAQAEDASDHDRRIMKLASVGLLRECLVAAFGKESTHFVASEYTTQQCHACGSIEKWDQARDLVHKCSKCGVVFDQDANACQNLLDAPELEPEQEKEEADAEHDGNADAA